MRFSRAAILLMTIALACRERAVAPASVQPPPAARPRPELRHPPAKEMPWWLPGCGDVAPHETGRSVRPPVVIHRVEPKWPAVLSESKSKATIVVEAIVTESGNVCATRVAKTLEGELGIGAAAAVEAALREWRFEPATYGGKRVAAIYPLTIRLNAGGSPATPAAR